MPVTAHRLETHRPEQSLDLNLEAEPQQHNPANNNPSSISFLGGMGYDQARNQIVANYFQTLGRETLPAPKDPDVKNSPKGYRVVSVNGSEKVVARPFAYLETAKPENVLIASRQQEARADDLIEHIEEQRYEHGPDMPVTHIAQSADAQNAVIAADKRPDLFESIIVLFPSGAVKKRRRTEYLRQITRSIRDKNDIKNSKEELVPENDFEATVRPSTIRERLKARRYKKSGGYAVAASAIAAYNSHLLHSMRQKKGAPGVAMVLGAKDKMMRPDRIIESLLSASDVDYILVTNTSHGINGRKDIAKEILNITTILENRNSQRKAAESNGETLVTTPLNERLHFMQDVPKSEQDRLLDLASKVPS